MDIYAQNVMDHYKNPKNSGILENSTIQHFEINTSCGDSITIFLILENDIIKNLKFKANGCAISVACASILSEFLIGKKVLDLINLKKNDFIKQIGVPISFRREKCALLGFLAFKNGILKNNNQKLFSFNDIIDE